MWHCRICADALAGKNFVKPTAKAPSTIRRTISIVTSRSPSLQILTTIAEKAKIFSINFAGPGLLPIFFVVTNDGDQPVSIANMRITLLTANHSKLTPIDTDDLVPPAFQSANEYASQPASFAEQGERRGGKKEMDEVAASQFAARAVEPHTTQSGFMFFDVGGIGSPLQGREYRCHRRDGRQRE